ncbi:hypothetical protein [Caudoviricetes sp.]|nr:hypothetical protein [Caudoviricetes sp.]
MPLQVDNLNGVKCTTIASYDADAPDATIDVAAATAPFYSPPGVGEGNYYYLTIRDAAIPTTKWAILKIIGVETIDEGYRCTVESVTLGNQAGPSVFAAGSFVRWMPGAQDFVELMAGGGGGATDLGYTASATQGEVTSSTGASATLPAADVTNAGLMLPGDYSKLFDIEINATADQTGAEIVSAIDTQLGSSAWQAGASNSFATIAVAGESDVIADSATDTLTLVAGTNVTITTNATTDSITIAASGGAASNSFATIAVSGQSDVVADSATDTLTLIAGSGMAITTNADNDEITFTSSGGYTDEAAQDAVGAMADTNTLTYTDATPLLSVKSQMSITNDASGLKLSGDSASPGNTKLYGTNGSGTKGWYDQPAGGSNLPTFAYIRDASLNVPGSSTASVALFTANGVSVTTGKTYAFEMDVVWSAGSTSTCNMQFGFEGTATISAMEYVNINGFSSTSSASLVYLRTTTASKTTQIGTANTAARLHRIRGYFTTSGSGTFIPVVAMGATAPAAASTVNAAAIKIWDMGASGAPINIGSWS